MSYRYEIQEHYIHVTYHHIVDALDIIQLTADQAFIDYFRTLKKVLHDFSNVDDVLINMEGIQQIALLSNMESNFTEELSAIIIPKDQAGFDRVDALRKLIKNPSWKVHIVWSIDEAAPFLQQKTVIS